MKTLFKVLLTFVAFLFFTACYAGNLDIEYTEDNDIDYESSSVQTSAEENDDRTEVREESEYDVDVRPYVTFKYTSSKTTIKKA